MFFNPNLNTSRALSYSLFYTSKFPNSIKYSSFSAYSPNSSKVLSYIYLAAFLLYILISNFATLK